MDSPPLTTWLIALAKALGGDDPNASLAAGLRILDGVGVHVVEPGSGASWLEIERQGHRLALGPPPTSPVDATAATFIEGLLGLAVARAAEKVAHMQTAERMEMLSSASFEGIMIHVDGCVIDGNDRLHELLGCEPHEARGEWPLRHCVAPEDLPSVFARMASGYEGTYVITGVRKDGTRFRAELQSKQGRLGQRPVRVVAVRDVTEREHTVALLRESEARLRDLAEAAFDVTFFCRDGIVVGVGGAFEALLGYTAHTAIGRPLLEFLAVTSHPALTDVLGRDRMGTHALTLLRATGELVPVEVVAVTSTLEGQPTRVCGIRDLRHAEREASDRSRLEQQVQRSQRLDSLGVLAGGVAHDFNNLLVGVLGNADLLLVECEDPATRESLQAIIDAASRAAGLTSQMLAYAGRGEVRRPEPVELCTLVRELGTLLASSLSKKADLVCEIPDDIVVLADPTTLSQVLMNLLTNASDALQDGIGRIEVRAQSLHTPDSGWDDALGATVRPGAWIRIDVEDTGVGMDAATLERIFEPFFTTKRHGHGLGLAASLGIVSAMSGALRVESIPGHGTTFSLLLPAATFSHAITDQVRIPEGEPCSVLIIDDEAVVRSQMRRCLELRGYRIFEAANGTAGLAALRDATFDLMIVDVTMPGLDGAEVVRMVRERGILVPIVLTSGYLDAATERKLQPGSFQAFLRKPYSVAELLDAVMRARSLPPRPETARPD